MSEPCVYCGGAVVDGVCEDCGKPAKAVSLVTKTTGGLDAFGEDRLPSQLITGRTKTSTRFTVNYPSRTVGQSKTKPTRRRADVSTHTSTRRNALGGGLISLPDLPSQDPLKLLMANPEVPANKRHCSKCDEPVNRVQGYCPKCGTHYDFLARLKSGDVIADKYEIKGPIAFGGLGWIYLGWDQVLQRWVVLKGLLNANDEASAAAAVAERRYLAALKHPKIVGIYDFVNHGTEGFIIMEYVGGITVHSLRKQKGPLPVAEAIAYILGILPAFTYLHGQGLVYCDFKPDNIMLEDGDVKLIDMGAVRKVADPNGDIYATVGFAAPEADSDPTAVSDLYTLGRALAVLIMDFKFSSQYEHSLPSPDEQPVLAENESLYRFLLRATHADPDERFQRAEEMAEQLFGVLREIVSLQTGPKPADSKVFTGDRMLKAEVAQLVKVPDALALPILRVNVDDRGANEVIRILGLSDPEVQATEFQVVAEKYGDRAVEPRLRLAELLIQTPSVWADRRDQVIEDTLQKIEQADFYDWRASWYRGLWLLTQRKGREALAQFERCYFEMPGELAPRLGMGMAAEMAGNFEQALPYYDRVGQVDPAMITAHVGAARCFAKAGELSQAVGVLQRVPGSHAMHHHCQLAIAELVLSHEDKIDVSLIKQAGAAVESALAVGGVANQIAGRLCAAAIKVVKKFSWTSGTLLGVTCAEESLRLAAEAQFRKAAKQSSSMSERMHWVEMANSVRPVTLF